MSAKRIRSGESPATAPLPTSLEVTLADEFLFARVQSFVALPVVLSGKCLPTNRTYKRALVRVRAQMGTQVVCASETFWAESTLECCWVFLYTLGVAIVLGRLVFGIRQP